MKKPKVLVRSGGRFQLVQSPCPASVLLIQPNLEVTSVNPEALSRTTNLIILILTPVLLHSYLFSAGTYVLGIVLVLALINLFAHFARANPIKRLAFALLLSLLSAAQIASRVSLSTMTVSVVAAFLALSILLLIDRWAKTPLTRVKLVKRTFESLVARQLVFKDCVFDEIQATKCTIKQVSFQSCQISRITSDDLCFSECLFLDVELGEFRAKNLLFTHCHFRDCRLFGDETILRSFTQKCTGDDASLLIFPPLSP